MMKKFKAFFNYWLFIGTNWNFWLATFTIYHEVKGEKKYGLDSLKIDRLKSISVKGENLGHASIYQACNYYVLEKGFNFLKTIPTNHQFVDFGSGKGRVLVVAAYYGFKRITGIDFAKALCQEAAANIQGKKLLFPKTQFNIVNDDVVHYPIEKGQDVFFFFNPFDEVIMLQVTRNLLSSFKQYPRKMHVMYANPVHKEIFLSAGFEEVYYLEKLGYLEMSILIYAPKD